MNFYFKYEKWCNANPIGAKAFYIALIIIGIIMWMIPSNFLFSWGGVFVGGYGISRLWNSHKKRVVPE